MIVSSIIGGSKTLIDDTLTKVGQSADAKAVGDKLKEKITAPSSAEVGQVVSVKVVDQNGVPTEFETVKMEATGGSGLPEVTTEDNGKIMQVVDGEWQFVDVVDAETVLFYADGNEVQY